MNKKEFLEEYVPSDCREEARKKINAIFNDIIDEFTMAEHKTCGYNCDTCDIIKKIRKDYALPNSEEEK